MHTDYWRFSLDVNHRSLEGNGRNPEFINSLPFNPEIAFICRKLEELKDKLKEEETLWNRPFMADIITEIDRIVSTNCSGEVVFL